MSENYGNYKSSYIKLCKTLNFKSKLSYSNGNKLGCSSIEELMELLTNTSGTGFTPIADFRGNFNGQNFEIKNLYINKTGNAGLFASLSNATIQNLTVSGKITSTDSYAGGIAAYTSRCNFINCTNMAEVIAGDYAGGVVAVLWNSNNTDYGCLIEDCYNYGNVTSAGYTAGGIIGHARADSSIGIVINNCANYGNINNTNSGTNSKAGGIVGLTQNNILVKNCYNAANTLIKGNNDAGGIVGYIHANDIIYNCYNLGAVEGTTVGGIARLHI